MSPDLQDEIEALNSIYGPSTLEPADDPATYVLRLPGAGRSSLRLAVPASYPDSPPVALSTFSLGDAPRDAAAAELALFGEALAAVFRPGMVCLYDAVEELSALLAARGSRSPPPGDDCGGEGGGGEEGEGEVGKREAGGQEEEGAAGPSIPWTLSALVTEQKSTFLAHVTPVSDPRSVPTYITALLASDRRIRQATHNICAWRVRGPPSSLSSTTSPSSSSSTTTTSSYQDYDDDGETAAGARLLHLLQAMDVWDVLVVVSRWYGGLKLGPRRFALINSAARDGLARAGFVREAAAAGGERKKKGKS